MRRLKSFKRNEEMQMNQIVLGNIIRKIMRSNNDDIQKSGLEFSFHLQDTLKEIGFTERDIQEFTNQFNTGWA